jgi:phytoene dehydrogenase-like protein
MPGSSATARKLYDAVVIGGGHNGLAAAAYLGRAGMSVLVLERRDRAGGAAISDTPFAGRPERLSRYAYLVSLLPRGIARDLGIDVELRRRRVSAYADGLLIADPPAAGAFASAREAAAWRDFYATVGAAAERLFPTFTEQLPSRDEARALLNDVPGAWEALAERPLGETLEERFEGDLVRGVVATDGLIGTFASLHDESLAQNRCFLYHVVGGAWRVPVGGMGAIAAALERAARAAGAELRTNAAVTSVQHGPETSEVRWDGGAASARFVLAGVAPAVLAQLEGRTAPETAEGCQLKVNMLLERLPRLRSGVSPEDAFAGTFRLNERADQLEAAYAQAAAGRIPREPPAELYCHSLTDRSIVGPGAVNSLTLFGLHTPASLFRADEAATRDALVERYLDALDAQLDEPIRDCLARDADGAPCIEARTPLDLERELGMPGGNIFHGELDWPWADEGAAPGGWGAETGHPRTFLCGAGARRGGGVSCVGGHNAAMAVLAARSPRG